MQYLAIDFVHGALRHEAIVCRASDDDRHEFDVEHRFHFLKSEDTVRTYEFRKNTKITAKRLRLFGSQGGRDITTYSFRFRFFWCFTHSHSTRKEGAVVNEYTDNRAKRLWSLPRGVKMCEKARSTQRAPPKDFNLNF